MLFMYVVFVMLSRLFIAALYSAAGKGLTSWHLCVMFNCVFVTFLYGIQGQVWNLIVSIPVLCRLSYFDCYVIKQDYRYKKISNIRHMGK